MPILPDRTKEEEEPAASELMVTNEDISPKSSRCALKCKYCGDTYPLVSREEWADGPLWTIDDSDGELTLDMLRLWFHDHSRCCERDGVADDRQPFLLSWS